MRRPDHLTISPPTSVTSRSGRRLPREPDRATRQLRHRGLTLAESLLAITIATVSGMAMLTSLGTAVRSSSQATDTSVAMGLASQLMDEVASVRFPDVVNPPTSGPRNKFDDIDDFSNYTASPPVDRRDYPIGTEGSSSWGFYLPRPTAMQPDTSQLAKLTQEVLVERVEPDGPTSWVVVTMFSDYRRVTVRITRKNEGDQVATLAELTRIFARVPPVP
jgi:type II secretory pathway pseudopilin PulG